MYICTYINFYLPQQLTQGLAQRGFVTLHDYQSLGALFISHLGSQADGMTIILKLLVA